MSNGRIVQKTRLTIARKYLGVGVDMLFPIQGRWYRIPHDELVRIVGEATPALNNRAWKEHGLCHWPDPATKKLREKLAPYRLPDGEH